MTSRGPPFSVPLFSCVAATERRYLLVAAGWKGNPLRTASRPDPEPARSPESPAYPVQTGRCRDVVGTQGQEQTDKEGWATTWCTASDQQKRHG